jgi:hypothetical protein
MSAFLVGRDVDRRDAGAGAGDRRAAPVLELRQYTLHPGMRDTLIQIFEDHFIEGQEACGMRIIGQFRDLDDLDRFVWLREFDGMDARAQALDAFYTGPVWLTQRDAANATMIDWRDVLLLKPASGETGFAFDATQRAAAQPGQPAQSGRGEASAQPALAQSGLPGGILIATIYTLDPQQGPTSAAFATWFRETAVPRLAQAGISVLAQLVTESAPNSYPRLPVREGEQVFVWFAAYPDRASHVAAVRDLERQHAWRDEVSPALRTLTKGEPQQLALSPTRRSCLTYRAGGRTR